MARNVHRVNGSVAHTVEVSIGSGTVDFEADSIPNTNIFLIYGGAPANVVNGELTIRVAAPKLGIAATTDAQGNFSTSISIDPAWLGLSVWTQTVVGDSSFGPLTGSNAVRVVFVP